MNEEEREREREREKERESERVRQFSEWLSVLGRPEAAAETRPRKFSVALK